MAEKNKIGLKTREKETRNGAEFNKKATTTSPETAQS